MAKFRAETRTLDETEFEAVCGELANRVQDFEPDALVGIAAGGAYVAAAMRLVLGDQLPHADIRVSRPATALKERLGAERILRRLPETVTDDMRRLEVAFRERSITRSKSGTPTTVEASQGDHPQLEKLKGATRVLIVDDTVDSGRTLLKACEAVSHAVPGAQIRTAVITSTWRNPPVQPDYCLYDRTLIRFFWSLDAAEKR